MHCILFLNLRSSMVLARAVRLVRSTHYEYTVEHLRSLFISTMRVAELMVSRGVLLSIVKSCVDRKRVLDHLILSKYCTSINTSIELYCFFSIVLANPR